MPEKEAAHEVALWIEEGVAVIELRRPKAGNALDAVMKADLLAAVDHVAAAGPSVRSLLLTAQGSNFCTGQDLKEHARKLAENPTSAFSTVRTQYNPLVEAFHHLHVPIVCAIEGACVGAGLGIALCADLRVAADTAYFATAFTKIGLAADSGLSRSLIQSVGRSRATGLILLGERFSAKEAHEWGLVHRIAPAGSAPAAGLELAKELAAGPTIAYREAKRLLRDAATADLQTALTREAATQEILGASDDHGNAVAAFLDRRQPVFRGR